MENLLFKHENMYLIAINQYDIKLRKANDMEIMTSGYSSVGEI
jgi:hypothetical protein